MQANAPQDTRSTEHGFAQLVERSRPGVEAALERCLNGHATNAARTGDDPALAIRAARALCLRGGKRWRAALITAAYEACGGEATEAALPLAGAAIELLQTYLLIHDDWMDDDDVRRGGPSLHAALRQCFGDRAQADAAAVLAGDFLCAAAQEALLSVPLAPVRVLDAACVFTRMQQEVLLGQLLDMRPSRSVSTAAVHDLKTGSYTVRGPVLLGAALAGASDAARSALQRYAAPLGLAFQLRDDLLGTFGEPAITGKPVGGDLRRGKRTALVEAAEADDTAALMLERVLGVRDAAREDVDALLSHLIQSGVCARLEARVDDLLRQAQSALVGAPLTASGCRALKSAAIALAQRSH